MSGARKLFIPVAPRAKQRPRVTAKGTYTPKETCQLETDIGMWYKAKVGAPYPTFPSEELSLHVDIYLSTERRGDVDNYLKALTDALNGIAYGDDKQIRAVAAGVFTPREWRRFGKTEPGYMVTLTCWGLDGTIERELREAG